MFFFAQVRVWLERARLEHLAVAFILHLGDGDLSGGHLVVDSSDELKETLFTCFTLLAR